MQCLAMKLESKFHATCFYCIESSTAAAAAAAAQLHAF
jgi:hypothetical protein